MLGEMLGRFSGDYHLGGFCCLQKKFDRLLLLNE